MLAMQLRNIGIVVIRRRTLLVSFVAAAVFWLAFLHKTENLNNNNDNTALKKNRYTVTRENHHVHHHHSSNCTLEYVNANKLPQDHPCVLDIIRQKFLNKPPPPDVPLNLDIMERLNPSAGQVTAVQRILRNLTGGFFIECGAADGETLSNTLFLEREMKWTGLLIEPVPESYTKLVNRNRKSITVPACLSLEKYPTEVSFDKKEIIGKIEGGKVSQKELDAGKLVNVQCFPLYSIMLAHGRTSIDFLSLDVEGHELKVLKTVPWDKVNITVMVVEWEHIKEGYYALADYMLKQGYVNLGNIASNFARDAVFMKDVLHDLRYDYYDEEEEVKA